jgi:hypothetical protein
LLLFFKRRIWGWVRWRRYVSSGSFMSRRNDMNIGFIGFCLKYIDDSIRNNSCNGIQHL